MDSTSFCPFAFGLIFAEQARHTRSPMCSTHHHAQRFSPPAGERHKTYHFPFWQGSRFAPFAQPALTGCPKPSLLFHVCPPLKRYRKSLPRGKAKRLKSSAIPPKRCLPSDFLALRPLSPCHCQALAHCLSRPFQRALPSRQPCHSQRHICPSAAKVA